MSFNLTLPRKLYLWSLLSSKTVISNTSCTSLTSLEGRQIVCERILIAFSRRILIPLKGKLWFDLQGESAIPIGIQSLRFSWCSKRWICDHLSSGVSIQQEQKQKQKQPQPLITKLHNSEWVTFSWKQVVFAFQITHKLMQHFNISSSDVANLRFPYQDVASLRPEKSADRRPSAFSTCT